MSGLKNLEEETTKEGSSSYASFANCISVELADDVRDLRQMLQVYKKKYRGVIETIHTKVAGNVILYNQLENYERQLQKGF